MSIKTLQPSEIHCLDEVHELSTKTPSSSSQFLVIGHRGSGMNTSTSSKNSIKENSIKSFNNAAKFPIQFIEFDVQVTKDRHPVIFHDIFIFSEEDSESRLTDLYLHEFLSYNHKPLLRKSHSKKITNWIVENDDSFCTLEEAFRKVEPHLGFNIELKFDDDVEYTDEEIRSTLYPILSCVWKNRGTREVIFSTFHPDAARLTKEMERGSKVYFLTDGGTEIYEDERRNSMEEAVKLCEEWGLDGIVAEVKAVVGRPEVVGEVKRKGVGLMTYGELNDVEDVVLLQKMIGVDGVIVDRVGEIAEYVDRFLRGARVMMALMVFFTDLGDAQNFELVV